MRTLAHLTAALAAVLLLGVAGLAAALRDVPDLISALALLSFPLVGVVIARRHPRNTVAWAFLGAMVFLATSVGGQLASRLGTRDQWDPHLVHGALWVDNWTWVPGIGLLITIGLAHFPDGRPLGPRWRWLDRAAVLLMAGFAVGVGLGLSRVSPARLLAGTPDPTGWRHDALLAGWSCLALLVPCVVAAAASLVLRWRRSGSVQRQQIRWVAAAGVAAVVLQVGSNVANLAHVPHSGSNVPASLGFATLAVATGVAIMRYRLYEIDRIISRTVAWTLVSGLLLGVYLGLATLAGAVIPRHYGSIGVAAATLAVAALFVPVRLRIGATVDRRFNRGRYDAERVVAGFATALRSRPDREDIPGDLGTVLRATVQPEHASLWLASTGGLR